MIALNQVVKRYPGGYEALKQVSLEIGKGELVCVTGPSGAGKSTLLKLLAAIERPTSGSVVVNGQNVGALRPRALPYFRRNFGLVLQDQKLLPDRTAFDNVALPLHIQGYDGRDIAARVRAALEKVGLGEREKALPVALSGGEQQRLSSPAPSCTVPPSWWLTNRPAIWMRSTPSNWRRCSAPSTRRASPWSSPPTTCSCSTPCSRAAWR